MTKRQIREWREELQNKIKLYEKIEKELSEQQKIKIKEQIAEIAKRLGIKLEKLLTPKTGKIIKWKIGEEIFDILVDVEKFLVENGGLSIMGDYPEYENNRSVPYMGTESERCIANN